jgi:hypothetical protein
VQNQRKSKLYQIYQYLRQHYPCKKGARRHRKAAIHRHNKTSTYTKQVQMRSLFALLGYYQNKVTINIVLDQTPIVQPWNGKAGLKRREKHVLLSHPECYQLPRVGY